MTIAAVHNKSGQARRRSPEQARTTDSSLLCPLQSYWRSSVARALRCLPISICETRSFGCECAPEFALG